MKSFFIALCTVVASVIMCSCSKSDKAQSFTVGFDADFPPYGYVDNGTYVGFDLDLAREVAKRNNWEIVLKPINWDSKDMELNSGSIDCIWNGFTINGREEAYTWSDPYVDNKQVVMVKNSSGIKTFADLAGKNVAVQTDTPVLKALQVGGEREDLGKTFKNLIITPTYNNAVMELESGSVEAIAMDEGVAKQKLGTNPDFVILQEIVMSEKYGIGFKKGNTQLRDQVQSTLKEMIADGTAASISEKYFEGKNILILAE